MSQPPFEPQPGQPSYGQPYGQQPGYQPPQQPGYQAPPPPGYDAPPPGYQAPQQPGYPAPPPGFPAAPPPGYPMAPPPKKKNTVLKIVLIAVAAVVVLCIAGVAAVFFIGKDAVDDAAKVTITEPATLGGRPKLEDGEFAALITEMESSLAKYPGASDSFGAFYGNAEEQDIVAAIATKATLIDPAKELDASFKAFAEGSQLKDKAPADTGALGGSAECATTTSSGTDIAVCGWADEGSVGMILWFFKTAADVQAEFPKLRAEIETKSK
ncbi:hypothetical protein [Actinoplanes sp. NPDC023714]|uniref:hypothetical protein n=1 Tax=Actinoplanes sp. NPDC023714 TaxID=3154322 RepID=UPI0033F96273